MNRRGLFRFLAAAPFGLPSVAAALAATKAVAEPLILKVQIDTSALAWEQVRGRANEGIQIGDLVRYVDPDDLIEVASSAETPNPDDRPAGKPDSAPS